MPESADDTAPTTELTETIVAAPASVYPFFTWRKNIPQSMIA